MTSEIKVNKISDGCGSAMIEKCGSTITVGTPGKNVILGASGQTVSIAGGATTSGMGRTGTVDWCTTAKTSPFSGVSGKGYFVDTSSGAVTVTLPGSSSAGDIISLSDYASTWDSNNVTLDRNSQLINAGSFNSVLNTKGQSITLVYVDGTRGWKNVQDSTSNVSGTPTFIVASGGTITQSGDYRIHTFTSDANFTICSAPTPANNKASYLVVAGGGAAPNYIAGGGGAGGFREGKLSTDPFTASPLAATPCSAVTLTAGTTYPITVGAGASAGSGNYDCVPPNGSNSVFTTITSTGGGKGGAHPTKAGIPGGSGGGGGGDGTSASGSGNTPPVSPPQGNNGSPGSPNYPQLGAGGGGGAGGAGGSSANCRGGPGGVGAGTAINPATGTPGPDGALRYYAGGGGGSIYSASNPNPAYAPGGYGGGGAGWGTGNPRPSPGVERNGAVNTGGGAGQYSSSGTPNGGTGGSGIVIIRYKYQ